MYDEAQQDDSVDMTVGETIAYGWWYVEGGGPISWNGNNRVADLGNGRWAVMQSGDDGDEFVEVEAPATAEAVARLLSDFVFERYATHSAIALEPMDPGEVLSDAVRGRISALVEDWAEQSGSVDFSVDSAAAECLRGVLGRASEDYRAAREALRNPLDQHARGFFAQTLDGIDTWEDVLDERTAAAFMSARVRAEEGEAKEAEELDKARELASDWETPPPQLRELLVAHGQGVWSEVEANSNVTKALLGDWARTGPNEVLAFVAQCELCDPELVRIIAERADSVLGQELMDFSGAEVSAIEGLIRNPDPASRILVASDGAWFYEEVDVRIQDALVRGWRYLTNDPDIAVREAAVAAWQQNLDAGESVLKYANEMAGSSDEGDRLFVAGRDVISAEALAELARDSSPTVRARVAQRSDLNLDVVAALLGDPDAKMRGYLARFQRLDGDQFRKLGEDPDATVREQVANRPATPEVTIDRLAGDEVVWVRVAVAGRNHLSERVTQALVTDQDPRVRRALASNLGVRRSLIQVLANDPDDKVRALLEHRDEGSV